MTLIDLQGKALYAGNKEIQRAYLGEERFYGKPNEVPRGLYGIPGFYEYVEHPTSGSFTMNGATVSDTIAYYRQNGSFNNTITYAPVSRTRPFLYDDSGKAVRDDDGKTVFEDNYYRSSTNNDRYDRDGNILMPNHLVFNPYRPGAGRYYLRYEAKNFDPSHQNSIYFSRERSPSRDNSRFHALTDEWKLYEEPVKEYTSTTDFFFYLTHEHNDGATGRVMLKNFEMIPEQT